MVDQVQIELKDTYKDFSKKDLKKELKKLKTRQTQDPIIIKCVAKLLRGKLQGVDVSSKRPLQEG